MPSELIHEVLLESKSWQEYEQFGRGVHREARTLARHIPWKKIVHVNSAELGGGVAELLKSQIPLERDLGLASRWVVITPDVDFFYVTKKIHNFLQGQAGELSPQEIELYTTTSKKIAQKLSDYLQHNPADIMVVHDPQPFLAAAPLAMQKIFRLHIDICQPNTAMMDWLCQHLPSFQHLVISREECPLPCLPGIPFSVIPPAIDPLTPKNMGLPENEAKALLAKFGVDGNRPLVSQVSRFDRWKDPEGVMAAYRKAKEKIPGVQLLLVGFFQADDDPESKECFAAVLQRAHGDDDIHLFSDPHQLGDVPNDTFINAVQVASDIVMQKSLREGFGLTVTEAMWKGKAVIGGDTGGIRLQIESGVNGVLVNSALEAAEAIVRLLLNEDLRKQLGAAAQRSVEEKFLMPRFVRDNLITYCNLS